MQGAIYTVQRLLSKDGRTFKTEKRPHKVPLPHGYKPELDMNYECDADHTLKYQQFIGILRWYMELGCINIQLEVALISQYQMIPRGAKLEALYLIFCFLWKNPKKNQVMDPSTPKID